MKNNSSKRTLPLIPELKQMLLEELERQKENRRKFGNMYNTNDSDYVFVDEIGKLFSPSTISSHFQLVLTKNGLPKIRFHELRHSCASLLIACGVGMKEVQEWLGHSAISTTSDIYSHLNYSSKIDVANKLSNVFGGTPVEVKEQDNLETKETLQNIFKSANPSKAEAEIKPIELEEEIFEEDVDESEIEYVDDFDEPEIDDPVDDDIENYRKAKAEMKRLGFNDYDEYLDFLEFQAKKAAKNKNFEM